MILVAGGSGRIGHLVVKRRVGQGRSVRVMTRNPSAAADLAHLQDVADAVVRATLDPGLRGRVIEVGGPDNVTFNEIARLVQASMKASGPLHHVPRPGLRAMGLVARPINPTMARLARRLARAALVMDTCDLTFDAHESTRAYPCLSCTPIATQDALVQH